MYRIEVCKTGPRRIVGLTHFGAYPAIGEAFGRLHAITSQTPVAGPAAKHVAIYYDDPGSVALHALTSFAGISVGWKKPLPAGLEERRLPGGRAAVLHHRGPYESLGAAYAHLYNTWLLQTGEVSAAVPYEIYLNSPEDTAPEDLQTDIYLPLK